MRSGGGEADYMRNGKWDRILVGDLPTHEMAGTRRAEIRRAFQNNRELQRFVLPEVRTTGRELGRGAYGSVKELEMNYGLVCAGKRLYEVFLEEGNADVENIVQRYQEECQVIKSA